LNLFAVRKKEEVLSSLSASSARISLALISSSVILSLFSLNSIFTTLPIASFALLIFSLFSSEFVHFKGI
jgi:hypothetical protein